MYDSICVSAGVTHIYYKGTFANREICNDWFGMCISNGCQVYIDIQKFEELLFIIKDYLLNNIIYNR